MPRVLVLDGDQPAALAIVRSLGRRGITVDVGERRERFLSSYSRFRKDAVTYPDPLADQAGFVEAIASRVGAERYDLVIPVAEDTVQPLAAHRARIEANTRLAIAPNDALETMLDKAKTFALAKTLGVPVPESWTFANEDEAVEASRAFRFPVVVKPSRSIAKANGARTKLSVSYAHDRDQLLAMTRAALAHGPVIVQEYFRGAGVGVELLADRGEVVYAFQHKRLHELPLTGGGSCLRESVPIDATLLEHSRRLMKAAKWHGVAMVEFKIDEATREHRLMEVNGRFWGSLPLAVAAGADFPYFLYELMTEEKRPDPESRAKIGVVCRKLSADVYWYVQVLKPDQDEPLITWPTKMDALRDFLLGFSPRHRFDVQTIFDPKPGMIDAWKTGEWFADRVRALAKQKRLQMKQERERARGDFVKRRVTGAGAREVLFICYGNINRSALAERHLRSLLPPGSTLAVSSAGFHPVSGRPADPAMVIEAKEHGLSLEGASSRTIDADMIARADVILGMELKHLQRLEEEHPAAREKAFLLSCVAPPEATEVPLEIADPYGGDEAVFARCFREITACTAVIAAGLDEASRP